MKLSKGQKLTILAAWMLLVPALLYIAITYFPVGALKPIDLTINLIIFAVIMAMPIRMSSVSLTLERWVLFYVFFHYGTIVEMLFIQLGMLLILFSDKSSSAKLTRFASNSLIFAIVSVTSASAYYFLGGTLMEQSVGKLVALGFVYASVYSIVNNLLLLGYFKFINHKPIGFGDSFLKDYWITILLLPFAIILCFLVEPLQNKTFFLIGIPFILVLLATRKFVKEERLNDVLTSGTAIGHQLAGNLLVRDVLDAFIKKLGTAIPYTNAYIVDLRAGGQELVLLKAVEGGVAVKEPSCFNFPVNWSENDGIDSESANVYSHRKSIELLKGYTFSLSTQSVMTVPLKRGTTTEGFLFLTSDEKYTFTELHLKTAELLGGYVTAAIDKAKYYEKTIEKSERCGLTGLHNFRYLERQIEKETTRFKKQDICTLAAIMMDIDHFKSINDTYGHQSGNDLLCAFAGLLRKYAKHDMTLARYGGEEFVLLLPGMDKNQAFKMAEDIRKEVEGTLFRVIPDLGDKREPIDVRMTISAGVASVPEDTENPKDVLRNADRALYIGGKQAGRNRVGVYGEEQIYLAQ